MRIHLMGEVRAGKEWRFLNHAGPCNRLYLVLDGRGYIASSRRRVEFRRNQLILSPVGTVADYVCTGSLHKVYVHFSLEDFPGSDLLEGLEGPVERSLDGKVLRELRSRLHGGGTADGIAAWGCLLTLIAPFVPREDATRSRRRIARARYRALFEAVESRPLGALRLLDLAPLTGLAPSTLVKSFRRDMGTSLDRFVRDRLVARARIRLAFTDDKVREVARDLGFEDEFYFSRLFKKNAGISPLDYRRARREFGVKESTVD